MEANKQLRYDLLKANQYDVEHAKACYEFIEGKEDNLPTRVEEVELPDGVYFVKRDGSVQLYTGQIFKEEEKSLYEYVGVKQGEKSLLIFCRDVCGWCVKRFQTGGDSAQIVEHIEKLKV